MTADRLVVLTGGPGGGKTTLLAEIARRGFAVTAEAGRALVRAGIGSDDPVVFAEAVLRHERASYAWALSQPGPVFFDRGMPDVAGSWLAMGRPVPAHVEEAVAACRYRSPVVVAPPWREIYVHDDERKHSWEAAVATYEVMLDAYARYGYDVVELPRVSVEERADFLLDVTSASSDAAHPTTRRRDPGRPRSGPPRAAP